MANKKYTTESFVEKAHEIHGDTYNYSQVVYSGVKNKVLIHCNVHDLDFEQSSEMHLKGYGCPKCAVEKRRKTMQSRYGVNDAMQLSVVVDKSNKKKQDKFGTAKVPGSGRKKMTTKEFIDKAHQVHGFLYDYSKVNVTGSQNKVEIQCPLHGSYFQTPAKHLSGHGCPHKDCIKARKEITTLERYGVRNVMQSSDIRQQYESTCESKYGSKSPFGNAEIKEKIKIGRINQKLKTNVLRSRTNVFTSICTEDMIHGFLCTRFGSENVERNYKSDVDNFECSFYVKSLDLYIENFSNSHGHGGHWFDRNSINDQLLLQSGDIDKILWSQVDVQKRNMVRKNNLNYVVFWQDDLQDAMCWFELGCPVGQDWTKEYSWFKQRDFKECVTRPSKLTGTPSNLSMMAKHYQSDVFYKHEIELWQLNNLYRGLPLQLYLYMNRLKYMNKLPDDLTDFEILRAFTIAGIHKGYTVFNTELMSSVIEKYSIKSVYDPCAGWGERMLCCKTHDVRYLGVDVNQDLAQGYDKMKHDLGIVDQDIVFGDSGSIQVSGNYDVVITCPPYYDIELYSSKGAENLSYDSFLKWWKQVVENSKMLNIRYFCFQINRKYRDDMLKIVEACGFELVDELFFKSNKSSHFTRSKDGTSVKKEKESMLVLKRV